MSKFAFAIQGPLYSQMKGTFSQFPFYAGFSILVKVCVEI